MESQDAVENPLEANEPEKRHHAVNSVIWTPLMLQSLIEGLLEQVHLGRRVEGAFKTQAYNAVLPQVQAHVQQEGLDGGLLQLTRDKLRTKVSWLKRLWEAWQAMLNEPQFSRDHETGKLVAAEGVWNNYLKDVRSLKLKSVCPALLNFFSAPQCIDSYELTRCRTRICVPNFSKMCILRRRG